MHDNFRWGTQYVGDVNSVLPTLPDSSFDACLCDPPYLLEFMGKEFDRQHKGEKGDNDGQQMYQWYLKWVKEVYRVLKPGGFILAFGGTRTSHRLACALEDVGFEIRDTIEWLYGSGFPKSLDIGKSIDRQRDDRIKVLEVTRWVAARRDDAKISNRDIDDAFGFNGMAGHWTSQASQPAIPTIEQVPLLFHILGIDNPPQYILDLLLVLNDRKGSPGDNWWKREKLSETVRGAQTTSTGRYGYWGEGITITAPATNESALWSGYGTALKPAHEPIILAMKPCQGTFAENALECGVAGLNIDGCRVAGVVAKTVQGASSGHPAVETVSRQRVEQESSPSVLGRWPANLILTHHETCTDSECHPLCPVRLLDEQAGDRPSVGHYTKSLSKPEVKARGVVGFTDEDRGSTREEKNKYAGERGNASRFFYCAKVSTRERNLGGIDNRHPTLKPISLTSYLSRLLIPPPRKSPRCLLIPFSGAGSEVLGSILSGWEHIAAIEFDPQYVGWSNQRIEEITMNGRVVHSSLKPLQRLGPESELPSADRSVGVIVRLYRSGSQVEAQIDSYAPKLDDFISGEVLPISDTADQVALDAILRSKLKAAARACLELSQDLKDHATRLQALAKEPALLHGMDVDPASIPDRREALSRQVQTTRQARDSKLPKPAASTSQISKSEIFD